MIYRAAYVIPMDGRVISNGEVLVRSGRILQVGNGLSASLPEEPVTDFGKCALLPGFVNTHCHLDYTFTRNSLDGKNLWEWIESAAFNWTRKPHMEIVRLSALLGAAELALSGVTCVADSSFTGLSAEALQLIGLKGIVYLELFGQSARADYARVFDEKLSAAQELRNKYPRLATVGLSPHSVYTSNREILELCAEACGKGVPIAIHLAETTAEIDYLLNGTGPIADLRRRMGYEPMTTGMKPAEYLHDVGLLRKGVCVAHCVALTASEIELVARSGVGVAHCPKSNAFLGCGISPMAELVWSGAVVGLGTDSAGTCLRFDFFEEMRSALAMQRARAQDAAVVSAKDVIELATIGGARALGLDSRIGTLEPGKSADFVTVDLSDVLPTEDIWLAILSRNVGKVHTVVVNGEDVVKSGKLQSLDRAHILAELEECLKVE